MTEQITRRHVNGGALKIGTEVHVSANTFADKDSVLLGETSIFRSTLEGVQLDGCNSFSSSLRLVAGAGCVFAESAMQAVICERSVFDNVKALGLLTLTDVVAENCELYGNWSLEGNARIPTGVWRRSPRYRLISGENGVSVGLTESTDGHALMACWRKPLKVWLHAGPRLGRLHNWSESQINDARLFFTELLDVPMET